MGFQPMVAVPRDGWRYSGNKSKSAASPQVFGLWATMEFGTADDDHQRPKPSRGAITSRRQWSQKTNLTPHQQWTLCMLWGSSVTIASVTERGTSIAAFHIIRWRTIYIPLPLIALLVFGLVFMFFGVLYSAGAIRGTTYAGIMVALIIVFILILFVCAGMYFFYRQYR